MIQYFINVIPCLKINSSIISNLQKRICNLTERDKAIALIDELEKNIKIARKEDIPYYHLFIAHCHLFIGSKLYKVEEHAKIAVDNFGVCHMSWNEAIGHWYLGLIFRKEIEYYFYLEELNKALEIVRLIHSERIEQGNYDEARVCEMFEKQWENEKKFAEAQSSTTNKKSRYHWVRPPEDTPFPSNKDVKLRTSVSQSSPENTPFPSNRYEENESHIRRIIIPVDIRALQDKALDTTPLESELFEELKKYDELIENHSKMK